MKNMTTGNIQKHIIGFAYPLFICNLLQLVNVSVNRIWAGKFLGEAAISSISIANTILYIMLSLAIGISIGTSTVVAQYFGANKIDKVNNAIRNSLIIVGALGVISTIVLNLFCVPILKLLDTPIKVIPLASSYLRISSWSFVFLFLWILFSFIYRAVGDSYTPVIFTCVGVLVNIILDPFLMLGIFPFAKLGIEGAGIAFAISNVIGCLLAYYFFFHSKSSKKLNFHFKNVHFFSEETKNIFKLGMPNAVQNFVISTGIGITQVFINKYGTVAISAFSVAGIVIFIILVFVWSIGASVSVIAGQNMGANNIKRVKETLYIGLSWGLAFSVIIALFCFFFPKIIMTTILAKNDVEAIKIGAMILKINAIPLIFFMYFNILDSFFNGVGANFMAMVISILGIWAIRIPLMDCLSSFFQIKGIAIALAMNYVITALISALYYYSGHWKTKSITHKNSFQREEQNET